MCRPVVEFDFRVQKEIYKATKTVVLRFINTHLKCNNESRKLVRKVGTKFSPVDFPFPGLLFIKLAEPMCPVQFILCTYSF